MPSPFKGNTSLYRVSTGARGGSSSVDGGTGLSVERGEIVWPGHDFDIDDAAETMIEAACQKNPAIEMTRR